jgi:type II secretory pathway pseudopilin PulG
VRLLKENGISLVELVATLVVAGIAIPVLMNMWATISWRAVGSENTADATSYARALMEEIRSKRFDQNTNSPWTNPANLGVDPGENRADSRTFNDMDDYINTTDPIVTSPAAGYIRSVSVDYVLPDGTNAWTASVPIACGSVGNCTTQGECCYKRITVNIWRADRMPGNVTLTTIMSVY